MGMYTGIRFKGYVKEQFRNNFKCIAMNGEWDLSNDEKFLAFSKFGRSGFIPCGALSYMPNKWEYYIDENGNYIYEWEYNMTMHGSEGFNRTWNKDTGYWTFQCSLKNYESEIEAFFELLPYFIESIDHLEYYYEEMRYSKKYELINNVVIMTNDKFVEYDEYGIDY